MTVLDRLLLAATVTGLAAVVWRVEQLRGEVTDKRIDSVALALQGWGRDERAVLSDDVIVRRLAGLGALDAKTSIDDVLAKYAPADVTRRVGEA